MFVSKIHELKIESEYLKAQLAGVKCFEIRKNDRDFQVGDRLHLREWDGTEYTGRETTVFVTYMTGYQQKDGYVVLGTSPYWFQDSQCWMACLRQLLKQLLNKISDL